MEQRMIDTEMTEMTWAAGVLFLAGFSRAIGLDAPVTSATVALTAYAADGGSITQAELEAAMKLLERAADLHRMPREDDDRQLSIPGA